MTQAKLARTMGFFALFAYGVGDILGAGIYALVGPVSAVAGTALWISFLIALMVAALTAMSYAEMCSRFPKSGGVSYFTQQAFNKPLMSFVSGWLLFFVSVVSMATLARAFHGYLAAVGVGLPVWVVIAGFLTIMGLINFRGLKEASWFNILSTAIELSGLLLILAAGFYFLSTRGDAVASQPAFAGSWLDILKGAALAFYAFIGFEDLANVAEEVKDPERTIPKAIMGSLLSAGALYLLIGFTATHVAGPERLAESGAPLTEVIRVSQFPIPMIAFSLIALFAVSNTCLLNSITASRLLFGLSEQKLLPKFFGTVHQKFRTPWLAIVVVTVVSIVLSILGSLKILAGATSVLILIVFASTNLSLMRVQGREPRSSGFRVPRFVPLLAFIANLALVCVAPWLSLAIAGGLLAAGFVFYFCLQVRK